MGNSSDDEESEISESEIEESVDKFYSQIQSNSNQYKVKRSETTYRCPFCLGKKKQSYEYKEIVQHASGIGTSSSSRHKPKTKAQHLALSKYLKHDLADPALLLQVAIYRPIIQRTDEQRYVWPWMGILVNLPLKLHGGQYIGNTADEIKHMFTQFKPSEVWPLWDHKGHTGRCVVGFGGDWAGFHNAMSFHKYFQSEGVGRREWQDRDHDSKQVHGWIAVEVDYNRSDPVGDHLRKYGVLKSVGDVMREESSKTGSRVEDLRMQIEAKNQDLYEMECKYNTSALSLSQVMEDKGKLTQAYTEELRKMEAAFCIHHHSIREQNEKLRAELEYKRRLLEERSRQLTMESSQYEINKQELARERQKRAEIEQQKANEEVLMLMEQQKRDREDNLKRIFQLQQKLEAKQQLELEIEKLKGRIEVTSHMGGGDDDLAVQEKMKNLKEELQDKIEEMEVIKELNEGLLEKESKAKGEVQEARKELIKELENILGPHTSIVLKKMGELKPEVLKKSAPPGENPDLWAKYCCSKLQEELKNPEWHPFKGDSPPDEKKVEIKDDEKLVEVRNTYGEMVYEAVKTALLELSEYNPEGRFPVKEIWNAKENRKATLKEVIQYIFKQWKLLKSKRRYH